MAGCYEYSVSPSGAGRWGIARAPHEPQTLRPAETPFAVEGAFLWDLSAIRAEGLINPCIAYQLSRVVSVMIKLRLPVAPSFEVVQQLPGLQGIALDRRFGVVPISPKEGLYVVRTEDVPDLEPRKKLSPEILEIYGDVRISTTKS